MVVRTKMIFTKPSRYEHVNFTQTCVKLDSSPISYIVFGLKDILS